MCKIITSQLVRLICNLCRVSVTRSPDSYDAGRVLTCESRHPIFVDFPRAKVKHILTILNSNMPKAASAKSKTKAKASEPIQYIYIVEETLDVTWAPVQREVLGTYETKEQANKAALDFAKTRHEDYWDSDEDASQHPKQTEDKYGCVTYAAEDEEGDKFSVFVKRHVKTPANAPNAVDGDENATTEETSGTVAAKGDTPTDYIYLVNRHQEESEHGGLSATWVLRAYKSVDEANAYAKLTAREEYSDWFVENEEGDSDGLVFDESRTEESEIEVKSDGCISISASNDEGYSLEIWVEKKPLW